MPFLPFFLISCVCVWRRVKYLQKDVFRGWQGLGYYTGDILVDRAYLSEVVLPVLRKRDVHIWDTTTKWRNYNEFAILSEKYLKLFKTPRLFWQYFLNVIIHLMQSAAEDSLATL